MEEQRNEYRNGPTEPRPKHNGITACLLILVIFLAGLVSVLGVMNIHLFHLLENQDGTAPLSFSQLDATTPTVEADSVTLAGMTIQEIPAIYQSVQELPEGLYIAFVAEDSPAHGQGILAGDVLVHFGGTPVTSLAQLKNLMSDAPDQVTLTVCRESLCSEVILEVAE